MTNQGLGDYDLACRSIMDLDPGLRFVGVINERGKLVAGGLREGLKSLEDPKDDEMLFTEVALRVRMRREFDAQLGKVRFAMSVREKVIIMSFPISEKEILYVSAKTGIDYGKISKLILAML
ncbi:MAG TPA: DUF6659 family protein [Candidatus Nitrosotalea sp.]|nr:DUF6659 family protein [Candidatus Nitrosotalea sp.]